MRGAAPAGQSLDADGATLDGRYRLGPLLGRGGMAEVRRGVDTRLRRPVAVKLVCSAGPVEPERFLAEIRTLARLEHPGIVRLLDAGRTPEGHPYLVMELVEGTTLAAAVSAGPIHPDEVARVAAGVAGGLAYVHARGIVHRDVKPANILLGPDDRVRLADFGIARLVDTGGITVEGLVVGTPAYLAPEQVSGARVGPPTDVYALGLVLAECLTGTRVFAGPPGEAAAARLRPVPLALPGVPPSWRALLAAMTSASPAERPTSAEVAAAVASLPGPSPVSPGSPGGRALSPAPSFAGLLEPDTVVMTSDGGDTEVLPGLTGRPVRQAPWRERRQAIALAAVVVAGLALALALGLGLGLGTGPGGRRAAGSATGKGSAPRVLSTAPVRPTATSTTSAPAATAPAGATTDPAATRAIAAAIRTGLLHGTVSTPAAGRLAASVEALTKVLTTGASQGTGPLTRSFEGLVSTFDGLVRQGQITGGSVGQIQGALVGLAAGLGLAPPPPAHAGPTPGASVAGGAGGPPPGPGRGHGHGRGRGHGAGA